MANEQKNNQPNDRIRKNQNGKKGGNKKHFHKRRHHHGQGEKGNNRAEVAQEVQTEAIQNVTDIPSEKEIAGEEVLDAFDSLAVRQLDESVPVIEIVGVRFRTNFKVYYFDPAGKLYPLGASVIVETSRGLEFGTITIANRPVRASEVVSPLKKILREATAADIEHNKNNRKLEAEATVICEERVKKYNLDMKIVDVEYTFDNSKLLFYFTSEGRVDFRELVKNLASIFRTRIELRQIGIRDEAKMMGGIGSCGRPFCCSEFLSDFAQVSIKMAKEQNFSLNSAKISGSCGRLMCCLRYEHEAYEDALKASPRVGATVSTQDGVGTVIEIRPLAGSVKVRLEEKNDTPRFYSVNDVSIVRGAKKADASEEDDDQKQD